MHKPTPEEKKDLLDLQKKPWYKVLLKLADDFEMNVLRQLKNLDTWNPKDLEILSKNMLYLKWAEAFMASIKTWANEYATRKEED